MPELQTSLSLADTCKTLQSWLTRQLDTRAIDWVTAKTERFARGFEEWEFFTTFSGASRHTGKERLQLSDHDMKEADRIRPGWRPDNWTADEAARILIMLSIAGKGEKVFLDMLEKTFDSSDMGEAVALYKSTAILPYPEKLRGRAAEGVRSNITSAFNAVAHRNPYPSDYFDDDAWNQMVLKALFVNSELYLIHQFDRRVNRKLAEMLVDFAHERWSAGRPVSPELWRAVGPFAEGPVLDDLSRVLHEPDPVQRSAAILALNASKSKKAAELLDQHAHFKNIPNLLKTWNDIGRAIFSRT